MQSKRAKIMVLRFSSTSEKPRPTTYEIKFDKMTTVLDALKTLKDKEDSSLTFRHSCGSGICGSCGMMINGKPALACQTYIKDLKQPIKIEPLRHFPIIKDLVTDIGDVFEKMRGVMPYICGAKKAALADGENKQTPTQLKKIKQASQCIKCMNCYSACPAYGNDKKFIGPMVGALAHRYNTDSRDQAKGKRMDKVIGCAGVWDCSFVGECSKVCPKRVDPATTMQRLKVMGALRLAKKIISKK